MLIDTETNRSEIEALFTGLSNDPSFVITSPKNPNYNCIAWASDRDNEWWWPIPNAPRILDGVKYNWPIGVPTDKSLDTFKKLFGLKNYTECENSDFDPNLRR